MKALLYPIIGLFYAIGYGFYGLKVALLAISKWLLAVPFCFTNFRMHYNGRCTGKCSCSQAFMPYVIAILGTFVLALFASKDEFYNCIYVVYALITSNVLSGFYEFGRWAMNRPNSAWWKIAMKHEMKKANRRAEKERQQKEAEAKATALQQQAEKPEPITESAVSEVRKIEREYPGSTEGFRELLAEILDTNEFSEEEAKPFNGRIKELELNGRVSVSEAMLLRSELQKRTFTEIS